MESGLQNFLDERNRALRDLDVEYARKTLQRPEASDLLCLTILHKARYECTAIEPEYRHASRAWLAEHGYGRLSGPLLPEGELPE